MNTGEKKILKKIGEAIKRERENKKLTQEELAEKLKLARTTITRIEAGGINIGVLRFVEIAGALNVNASELLKNSGR